LRRILRPIGIASIERRVAGKGFGERALRSAKAGGWLAPRALCVVEEAASAPFEPGAGFSVMDERGYGETVIRFIEAA
jgi:16S rRNA (guanine966-N2)-methyltransferase